MAIVTREAVNPPIIENTSMSKVFVDGVHKQYEISPVEGYVLHDSRSDSLEFDDEGMPTGNTVLGYCAGPISVAASYDFTENPLALYSVLRSTVPENNIFGGNNNHETV